MTRWGNLLANLASSGSKLHSLPMGFVTQRVENSQRGGDDKLQIVGWRWGSTQDFRDWAGCHRMKERFYRLVCRRSFATLSHMEDMIVTHAAAKDLDALPRDARQRVENGPLRYATTGQGDVKQLSGRDGFRLRIGRYRVLFDEDQTTILAIYIGKRETTTYRKR